MVGHASVFDEWTTLYQGRSWVMREVVRPGAFARAIRENQDVRSLFNHDSNFVLGRTRSGTLKLNEDKRGLLSETDLPDTQTIRDLVVAPMEDGDISQMSFAFIVKRAKETVITEREDGSLVIDAGGERITEYERDGKYFTDREVLDADLFDVSAVTYPAYEGTDVAVRSRGMDVAAMEAEALGRWASRRLARERSRMAMRLRLECSLSPNHRG